MNRKQKIRRAFILIFALYIIINIFVFGLMKAYMNTNNIISRNQLVMASVTENNNKTQINILGKTFEIDTKDKSRTIVKVCTYSVMPEKARVCTDIVLILKDIIIKIYS